MTHDSNDMTAQFLRSEGARLADLATKASAAAKELDIENKTFVLPLDDDERAVLAELAALPNELCNKLSRRTKRIKVADATRIVAAVADALATSQDEQRTAMHWAARKLLFCIHEDVLTSAWRSQAKKRLPTRLLYQLKITLVGIKPAIWRRIQIKDGTFDRLHEYVQTAMGWTNSHLHRFEVDGQLYGDPELLEEDMQEMMYRDSTLTLISSVLTKENPGLCFRYEYDFGDSWEHEIVFEGCPEPAESQKYPLCVEGERACPPEDVGGIDGYARFLGSIQNRNDSERVGNLEWAQGWFDPEEFDPVTATKSMWKGIFDWRNAREF